MPSATRWWGKIKQNKRVVRLKPALVPALEELLNDDSIPLLTRQRFELQTADWQVFIQFADILAPFKAAIKIMEGITFFTKTLIISCRRPVPHLAAGH
jgi:hypothetical protein